MAYNVVVVMARPTKLTPELQEELCKHLNEGLHIQTSCALVDIDEAQFYRWKKAFPQFRNAVEKARANSEKDKVKIISDAGKDNWQAAAWFLERSYPDRWGRTRTDVFVKTQKAIQDMSDEELAEIANRLQISPE